MLFENREAVLKEVELFVARRSPRNRHGERSTYVSPSSAASLTIKMLLFFFQKERIGMDHPIFAVLRASASPPMALKQDIHSA